MSKPRAKQYPFSKIVVLLAVSLFIGMGLCGLDATLLERYRNLHNEFGPNTFVGSIGAIAILLSAAGLVITTIAWVVTAAVDGFNHRGSGPQKLLDEEDDTKHDQR
jgi:hypothetical protein